MRAVAVAVLFTAGLSEFGIEPGSEKALNKYLFQRRHSINTCFREKRGKVMWYVSQGPREGWGSPRGSGW